MRISSPYEFPIAVVLDDEKDLVQLVMSYLYGWGWSTVGFCYPEDALKFLKRNRSLVRLHILDIKMPHMDGLEYLKRLTKLNIRVPTVFVSGCDEELVLPDWCVRLHKPFGRGELEGVIKTLLKGVLNGSIGLSEYVYTGEG